MGNIVVGGRESIGDHDVVDQISDFEHCFPASCEDATDDLLAQPLPGYTPSTGPPTTRGRGSKDTINEPLKGRLMAVHMLETELVLKEAVGVVEQIVVRIPYLSIRVLTWDHATSSLKVDYEAGPSAVAEDSAKDGGAMDGQACLSRTGRVFISVRVENSIDVEDELKQRARAEAVRAKNAGRAPQAAPTSVYLGMFAGFTKPKPFQRKRPNLSFSVPEGKLPSLKEMRRWSFEEHEGISRPQLCSLRPKYALDAVYLGENRFSLSAVDGLALSSTQVPESRYRSVYGELVLSFACAEVQLRADCGKNAAFKYDEIDDWSISSVPGTGPKPPSGLILWILLPQEEQEEGDSENDGGGDGGYDASAGSHQAKARKDYEKEAFGVSGRREKRSARPDGGGCCRRVFLGIPDEDLVLARNSMEYFWNSRRAELRLPPKAGSTHGRCVASMVTLRGEVKAPALPTGRINPVDLDGVEVRVGQVIQLSPRRGQLNLLPSPRVLLGVEKKRTLRHNATARSQWERVVVHQGWLRKRGGGAIKRWVWRYFTLYDTPQGHFLAYYNDVSEVPLFSEDRKERQVVDLCKVCFLRPEIGRQRLPGIELPANAFTIVTTERQWTLAADCRAVVLEWLRMISVAVDEDVAVVDDGEIMFEAKVHWANQRGEYGPEHTSTIHLGSMGMELRYGYSEAVASSLAALAGQPTKRSLASASNADHMRFWSFTDFYKWTIVVLQGGAPALTLQCFTDDEFKTKEDMMLITPRAKQLALAIEHQVEKFMSVMHLRLEHPDNMAMTSADVQISPNHDTGTSCTAAVARRSSEEHGLEEGDGEETRSVAARIPNSATEEMYRAPSMNLATDPASWVGDATITPCTLGWQAFDDGRGINPFDSSSDEEGDSEAIPVRTDVCGRGELGTSLEAPCEIPITKDSNPFDFSFCDGHDEATVGKVACGRQDGVGEKSSSGVVAAELMTPVTRSEEAAAIAAVVDSAVDFPGSQSSRVRHLFPSVQNLPTAAFTASAAPSPAGVTSIAETPWNAAVNCSTLPNVDQLMLTTRVPPRIQELDLALVESPSTSIGSPAWHSDNTSSLTPPTNRSSHLVPSPAAGVGAGAAIEKASSAGGKCLPPTPLRSIYGEGVGCHPNPTPPITPLTIPTAKVRVDLCSSFRDPTDVTPPSPAQAPANLLSSFWNETKTTPWPLPTKERADLFFAFRDGTETPPLPLQSMDLHVAFRDRTAGSQPGPTPPLPHRPSEPQSGCLMPELPPQSCVSEPLASLEEVDSSQRQANFNPFGTPGSFVLCEAAMEEPSPPGKVLHDNGSSMRVVIEDCVKLGRTCSITIRYDLQLPPKTTFSVEFSGDGDAADSTSSSPAIEISFKPNMTSVLLDGGANESGGSRRRLRQVLSVTCVRAFSAPPEIAIATSYQPLAMTKVALPMITVAAFLAGLPINPDEFRRRWTALICSEKAVVNAEDFQRQHREQHRGSGRASVISTAEIKRFLGETLGMRDVVQHQPAGAAPGVELIAAAGELLLTTPSCSERSAAAAAEGRQNKAGSTPEVELVCLVGAELHTATGAMRVTTKSTDPVLAESVQKTIIQGIAQIRTGNGGDGLGAARSRLRGARVAY